MGPAPPDAAHPVLSADLWDGRRSSARAQRRIVSRSTQTPHPPSVIGSSEHCSRNIFTGNTCKGHMFDTCTYSHAYSRTQTASSTRDTATDHDSRLVYSITGIRQSLCTRTLHARVNQPHMACAMNDQWVHADAMGHIGVFAFPLVQTPIENLIIEVFRTTKVLPGRSINSTIAS